MAETQGVGAGPWVAFFRNMNLGQRRSKSPTSGELLSAFADAGAAGAVNVQTNGTVIFPSTDPTHTIESVRAALRVITGYQDTVIVREGRWVLELAVRLDPTVPHADVSLFDADGLPDLELPWVEPTRRALTVLALDRRHAVSSWQEPLMGSNATTVLGRLLGVPVTSRGVPTMLRLATRLESLLAWRRSLRGRR
jgi:uncharacterized protein (DUF1697 family)